MAQIRDIRALTGIRGVAALVVLMYHLQGGLDTVENHGLMRFGSGYLAVDLFFILSGFVMSLNYRSRFSGGIAATDYAGFLLRRAKRLLPLYWVICCIAVAKAAINLSGANALDLSLGNIAENLALIHAWGFQAERFVVPSWSVSAEFVAYILFPLVVLISSPFRRRWVLVAAVAGIALLLIVKRSGLGEAGPMDVYQAGSFYPVLRCLAGFGLGMAAHAASETGFARRYLSGDALLLALLAGVALCVAFHADVTLIAAVFPVLIVNLALNGGLAEDLFGNGPVYWLGLVSYSIYLVHWLVIAACVRVGHMVAAHSPIPLDLTATLLAVTVTISISALTYRTIERGAWRGIAARVLPGLRRFGSGRERAV